MRIAILMLVCAAAGFPAWRTLPEADLGKISPSMFTDEELDLPYFLAHFHRVANAVVEEGPDRGFIRISVWRAQKDNQPYNARIMESILSLAYFYTTKRPWNVYYGSPALRERLEAALEFWCRIQGPDGQFSEYKPQGWNLAATAFATKFMGQTLNLLLKDAPPIDAGLLKRVQATQRKAILFVLTDPAFYQHARNFSNQFTNVWPGAMSWLAQRDDPEIRKLLDDHVVKSAKELQSPVGYFYEAGGPDWGYNLGTHMSNLHGSWQYSRGTKLEAHFVEEARRFGEWLSWNVVKHGDDWLLNRAIETRQQHPVARPWETPLAERVPVLRAFVPSREEIAKAQKERRAELERNWPRVRPMPVGDFRAFDPYTFLHRSHVHWFPTQAEKDAAAKALPYARGVNLVHQRMDSRSPVVFTYVSRPGWYAAITTGKQIRPQQRYGIGLMWNAKSGALLQSQTGTLDAAWGTLAGDRLYEAGDLAATFRLDGKVVTPEVGTRDLGAGELVVEYPLGERGRKRVVFGADAVQVTVEHPGEFVELVPAVSEGLRIEGEAARSESVVGRVRVVRLAGRDRLTYTLR